MNRRRARTHNIIPFDVNFPGGTRAKVTWDSVLWFGLVTTAASIAGSYLWEYVIAPRLPAAPATGGNITQTNTMSATGH